MTIHSTDPDAVILFVSDSVYDILGYTAQEVQGKSCFEFFHPEEVPFARSIHTRGVLLDKAAVLHYVRIQARDGQWVSCECCFTVVHDVLVACTSIYRRGEKSESESGFLPAALASMQLLTFSQDEQSKLPRFVASFRAPLETLVTTCSSTCRPNSGCHPWNASHARP